MKLSDLNDFRILGNLIEKEFDVSFIGLSKINGYPIFLAYNVPIFLKENFECVSFKHESTGLIYLTLEKIYHEHIATLQPIIERYDTIEKFNEKLKELDQLI